MLLFRNLTYKHILERQQCVHFRNSLKVLYHSILVVNRDQRRRRRPVRLSVDNLPRVKTSHFVVIIMLLNS